MVNKSLITLIDETSNIERALIESSGEITDEIAAILEAKDLHLPEKIDSYAFIMDRMVAVANFYADKAAAYEKLSRSARGVIERCEFNLKMGMLSLNTKELSGFDFRYRLVATNPACVIEDESKIDGNYIVTETVKKIDKKRIAEDLKIGVPVEGAHLEQRQSLRRFMNTPSKKAVQNE